MLWVAGKSVGSVLGGHRLKGQPVGCKTSWLATDFTQSRCKGCWHQGRCSGGPHQACARSIHPSWVHRDCPHAGAALDLIATVSHHGRTLASGHYTADVRQVCARLPSLRSCCGAPAKHSCLPWPVAAQPLASTAVQLLWEFCARTRPNTSVGCGTAERRSNCSDALQEDGRWLRFDDSNVVAVPLSRVLDEKAYLLFYQLRG